MKKILIGIIITLVVSTTGVLATTYLYKASDIEYTPQDEEWDVDNVESAISDLYEQANGKKSVTGSVTIPTAYTPVEVNIGFKPGYVATVFTDGSSGTDISVYNKDWDTTHAPVNGYNYNFPTEPNNNGSNGRVFELTDTGFKVKSNTAANVTIYYFAIEE